LPFQFCWIECSFSAIVGAVSLVQLLEEGAQHHLVTKHEAHKRIIWACSWNPFGYEFATGSRDKTVKIWCVQDASVKLLATLPLFRDSVTALSWTGRDRARNAGIIAVGMDNGLIELWSVSGGRAASDVSSDPSALSVACMLRFDPLMCHVSTVHRLRWQKSDSSDEKSALELASCGADHCTRVFAVRDS
jgi:elongator complex protein 2